MIKKPKKKAKIAINDIWAEGSLTKAFTLAAKLLEDEVINEHAIEAAYTEYDNPHGWTVKIIELPSLQGEESSIIYHRAPK